MLKKLLKVGTTLTLLLGCYFGYVRAFDLVIRQFQSERLDDSLLFKKRSPRSWQEAQELARLAFGPDHWTVTSTLPFAYYNSQKNFWMYWQDYEEVKEENGVRYDGKRVRMRPFAMIGRSGDGKNIWRLIAEEAILDLNQPIGLGNKPGSDGIKVEHAVIERNVWIRDDRGTPHDPSDDMNVGPLTYLEYDDAKRQITSTSHVVIKDPDQTTIGDGLEINLRKPDPNLATPSSSASGFGGADRAILQANVHVAMRDVGDSGIFSGAATPPPSRPKAAVRPTSVALDAKVPAKDEKGSPPGEPVPLYVWSAGPMTIDFPPDTVPVAVGPPAPPAPTLVRFEREVVAAHGHLERNPNQLDCDTLRLTLVPPPPGPPQRKGQSGPAGNAGRKDGRSTSPTTVAAAETGPVVPSPNSKEGAETRPADGSPPSQAAADPPKQGFFGNLTLEKAHATGYVVWLQLRQQSAKVRCTEMIHERCMPYRPDTTFFRGDKTHKVWLEKIDYEEDEPAAAADAGRTASASADPASKPPRKVKSVTHVETISAKLFDRGNGMDLVDVRAFGPGRLESRPDMSQPVERIAVWQDELTIVNIVGSDGKLRQKRVTLTGNRPFFVDLPKKSSLDAAQEIRVFLKPRSEPEASTTRLAAGPPATATSGDAFAATAGTPATKRGAGAGSGLGGSLQIERLLAYRDVHFKAPNRYMEARDYLDAPFVEVDPTPATTPEPDTGTTTQGAAADAKPALGETAPKAEESKAPAAGGDAARGAEPEPPAEPAITAVANRIWAKVAIPRGQSLDPEKDRRRKKTAATPPQVAAAEGPGADPAAASTPAAEPKEAEAEIRQALLRGNVAVHQDKPPDPARKGAAKPRGSDICGEMVYLDNRGKGKIYAEVYNRDKDDKTPLLGPIRWAKVSTDDMITYGETLWMDQGGDKIWAKGPGVMNQWTDRSMMTDQTPGTQPAADGAAAPAPATAMAAGPRADARPVDARPAAPAKPKTRAGRPIAEKDLLTITWTKSMEFTGRTRDPAGRPAGRADFLGLVHARMTDAELRCDKKMIVFTDREVPLGELGASMGGQSKIATAGPDEPALPEGDENAGREAPEKSRVDIAMIYCFGRPSAVSRKVDPDLPRVNEQQVIDAWDYKKPTGNERLDYNRRTGEFYVPGPGTVYLYDRADEKPQQDGAGGATGTAGASGRGGAAGRGGPGPAGARTVTPTSARTANRNGDADAAAGRGPAGAQPAAGPAGAPASRKSPPPPLVLMQVKFRDGMKGRMGTGRNSDPNEERWSEFYGNIEFLRSQVLNEGVVLDPDKRLSPDGFYLTSQMLRIIQEPPPPGSHERTPPRNWAKAWDRVHVNKGEFFSIESDVTTFDSGSDLLWAYGENGRGVTYAHQSAPGQPPSTSTARAVQYNVKTHAWNEVEGSNIIFIDQRTGARPPVLSAPDPTAPPKPKPRTPFKVPNTNLERRGFTGY